MKWRTGRNATAGEVPWVVDIHMSVYQANTYVFNLRMKISMNGI